MKFLNKATGAVIDVPCALSGPDWEEVTEAKAAATKAAKADPEEAPTKAAQKKKTVKKGDA